MPFPAGPAPMTPADALADRVEQLEWIVSELTTMPPAWLDTNIPGLRLRPKEARMFALLMRAKGRTVGYDAILAAMYPESDGREGNSGVCKVTKCTLNRKLGEIGAPVRIANTFAIGYRIETNG